MRKIIVILFALCIFIFEGCGKESINTRDDICELRVGNMAKSIKPAMIVLASEMGYYSEEGVNVIFEDISSINDALIAIEDGKLDVNPLGIIPTMTHVAKNADLVIFGGTISEGGQAVATSEAAESINSILDFKGKTIAVIQAETGHLYAEYYLRNEIIDFDNEVNVVVLDSMQSVIQAVIKGEADIGWVNSGFGQVAEQQGLKVVMGIADLFPDNVCCRQTTSREVIDKNREALVRFQVANLRAYLLYRDKPEEVISKLMEYSGQSREYVEYCLYAEVMKVELDPCAEKIKEFYSIMTSLGLVDSEKEDLVNNSIDSTIYKEALDRLISRYPDNSVLEELCDKYELYNE